MSSGRRMPVLPDAAYVTGPEAFWIVHLLRDDVVARLDRHPGITREQRRAVLDVFEAMRQVGVRWASQSRNDETADEPDERSSDVMDATEAAQRLGVSIRRVQQLAPQLGGRKVGNRWVFDRDRILEEAA